MCNCVIVEREGFGLPKIYSFSDWMYAWLWTRPMPKSPQILIWEKLEIYSPRATVCVSQNILGGVEEGLYTRLSHDGWPVPTWCNTIVVRNGAEVLNDLDYWKKITSMA